MNKKVILIVVVIVLLIAIVGGFAIFWLTNHKGKEFFTGFDAPFTRKRSSSLVDDWKYSASSSYEDGGAVYSTMMADATAGKGMTAYESGSSTIGLSVGGSKNIENFRENIKNGYFPISTDITYNGLFYDYYFNTGDSSKVENKDDLFYPAYSTAVSKDPVSGSPEYYMTVGLNSNIKESDFARKKLNLIVVMDISGSMGSKFNSYYYDGEEKQKTNEEIKSKMQIANESLNLLLDELNPEDRVGIVLFDDGAYLAKPVSKVEETDLNAIKEHVLEIKARGGTNFEAGYKEGTELFTEGMLNDSEYENRIIVITDAMPNLGETSRGELTKFVKENAEKQIYTTFIGVGVDFNTAVIETLSDVKGANYYSVHNSEEFKKIMSEDFEYMVTPLVFDLELKLDSNEYEIKGVYGTDTQDKNSGTIMKVNTLFPSSRNSSGEAKGGVVLLKLSPKNFTTSYQNKGDEKTKVVVSYKDRDGKEHKNDQVVSFENTAEEYYENTGIRKAIALTRYANLMKNWILYERGEENRTMLITVNTGIKDCEYCTPEQVIVLLGENERSSVKLSVSKEYSENFKKFKEYLEKEIKEIGDDEMKQEIDILNMLIKE